MTRKVAVFTSSRADLGPLGPVVRALDEEPRVELLVLATGTHLAEQYGGRLIDIQVSERSRVEVLNAEIGDSRPQDLGEAYGRIATGTSRILGEARPDILVLLGDRWELLAAAGAALLHGVPIAHLHGGETTEGAIDERIRHGITKLSDLHLCASEESARRIRRLGEEPWRIVVTGAPGLDRLRDVEAIPEDRLEELLGRPAARPFGVVVYHPPTVDRTAVGERARAVFDASARVLGSAIVLYPGADPGSEAVVTELKGALARHPNLVAVRNLGDEYVRVLAAADVLVGNSSSGIIEAASLSLPVVDVGERQRGRLRPANVIHVDETEDEIRRAIERALSPEFLASLEGLENPYGRGDASQRITRVIVEAPLDSLAAKPWVEASDLDHRPVEPDLLIVGPDATLRDAMATIERGRSQIAFVADRNRRLLGSLTDGDVRRALLAGADLDAELAPAMNRVPIVAQLGDPPGRILQLMERNSVTQIPVVDDQGVLVGVHFMKAIVGDAIDRMVVDATESG